MRRVPWAWLILFGITLGFWLVLSGHFGGFYVASGVASAALVATVTVDLEQRAHYLGPRRIPGPLFRPGLAWRRFPRYVPWLLWQMVRSALGVAAVLVRPRLRISPVMLRLPCRLPGALALTAYANSITLTPGTVAVDVEDGELVVHALTAAAAEELRGGAMEARVGWTFGGER